MISESKTRWRLRQDLNLITGSKRDASSAISKLLLEFQKVAIFGGAIRDLALGKNVNQAADIDIVVDTEDIRLSSTLNKIEHTNNKFGGIRFKYHNRIYDIWPLKQTWAFKEGYVQGNSFEDLIRTTFFVIDASYYSLPDHQLYCHSSYFQNLINRVLDINLEPNPNPAGMAKRALKMAFVHNFSFTPRLVDYVLKYYQANYSLDEDIKITRAMSNHLDTNPLSNFSFSGKIFTEKRWSLK
jgi:predicted nucleotidyltransferase